MSTTSDLVTHIGDTVASIIIAYQRPLMWECGSCDDWHSIRELVCLCTCAMCGSRMGDDAMFCRTCDADDDD